MERNCRVFITVANSRAPYVRIVCMMNSWPACTSEHILSSQRWEYCCKKRSKPLLQYFVQGFRLAMKLSRRRATGQECTLDLGHLTLLLE